MITKRPTLLCVLDGYGLNPNPEANAVALAKKPNIDKLFSNCANTTLTTSGTKVGLPEGHMGNSEVGHLNIGAGRMVEQWLYRIGKELGEGFLQKSATFNSFLSNIPNGGAIHLVGLFSNGGVHSDAEHLFLIINELIKRKVTKIVLHIILDGRDTSPTVGIEDVRKLLKYLQVKTEVEIGSVSGRFFAMDRDKRWERTECAYKAIVNADGLVCDDLLSYLEDSYTHNVTDEFIEPVVITKNPISKNDGVFFYNFRADRMRQIVAAITHENFTGFQRSQPPVKAGQVLCMTEYDHTFSMPYLFEAVQVKNHLGEVISKAGLKQLRTAETEKYPHVTYFFNGLNETPLTGETREMVPSPREVKTYDLKPEMNAAGVEAIVIKALEAGTYDLIIVNFANCDMVGHTGVLEATIKAVETVDGCLGRILTALEKVNGQALIIADHGNAEQMIDYDTGLPYTAHTTFQVPAILFGRPDITSLRSGGALCDVAPTILKLMEIPQPEEMTGLAL